MELDHLFILCDAGAPEAETLRDLGLHEGSSNVHPGQGTACRRFFFETSYLELLWVENPDEAQSPVARDTGLWDRWINRHHGGSPFGVVLRPDADAASLDAPFATIPYSPTYLSGASIGVALDAPPMGPAFFWLPFQRNRARVGHEPTTHRIGRTISRARIGVPALPVSSEPARIVATMGVLIFDDADDHFLELTIADAPTHGTHDLRPRLPLILRW
jgi:hypothetical protein